ncbi:MAG: prepilin-type N-terminal cleavage/methylation domain-containing protein [Ezakiella sp.]|nr:prepilin-type N-terminal cleavage/methylation domain-containing protein [Ezakiella sp.]MDD7471862.1 prepilin-type N-terminal cleavage/methylation domain-containing protein [Bacillota bacterium]MDY3923826.1 prepilin-type N-terminal cleavage/methylation domain-containing protein [Ezakiella sp.]
MKYKKEKLKAFTLLEIIIVLVVISIFLLVALPSMNKFADSAKNKSDELNMLAIKEAATLYLAENPGIINSQNNKQILEVKTLVEEGYLDIKNLKDSDENEFKSPKTNLKYEVTFDKNHVIVSNGTDKIGLPKDNTHDSENK